MQNFQHHYANKITNKRHSVQRNVDDWNTDGSCTMDDLIELVFESLGNSSDSLRKQIFREFSLFFHENV